MSALPPQKRTFVGMSATSAKCQTRTLQRKVYFATVKAIGREPSKSRQFVPLERVLLSTAVTILGSYLNILQEASHFRPHVDIQSPMGPG